MKSAAPFFFLAWLFAGPALLADAIRPPGDVRFEQKIGQHLPMSTVFSDLDGNPRSLGSCFNAQPAVLYFGYARCPQLCSVVADGTVAALCQLQPSVGRDFQVISISIDPSESRAEARSRQQEAVNRYGRNGAAEGWHYLTGTATAIQAVATAAGFHFLYDPRSGQYAHPSGFVVVTPNGVISRYFLGVDFAPAEVATALNRASRGETGPTVFDLLLLCFRGDGIGGRYGVLIWRALWVSVVLTVAILTGGIGWMLRQERRGPSPEGKR